MRVFLVTSLIGIILCCCENYEKNTGSESKHVRHVSKKHPIVEDLFTHTEDLSAGLGSKPFSSKVKN